MIIAHKREDPLEPEHLRGHLILLRVLPDELAEFQEMSFEHLFDLGISAVRHLASGDFRTSQEYAAKFAAAIILRKATR